MNTRTIKEVALANPDVKEWSVKVKTESWLHKTIGLFLNLTGINKHYMTAYWTTIGRTIWVPDDETFDRISQDPLSIRDIEILFHEIHHIRQSNREGFLSFAFNYLLFKKKLMNYELEAYKFQLFVKHVKERPETADAYIDTIIDDLIQGYGVPESYSFEIRKNLEETLSDFRNPHTPYLRRYLALLELIT